MLHTNVHASLYMYMQISLLFLSIFRPKLSTFQPHPHPSLYCYHHAFCPSFCFMQSIYSVHFVISCHWIVLSKQLKLQNPWSLVQWSWSGFREYCHPSVHQASQIFPAPLTVCSDSCVDSDLIGLLRAADEVIMSGCVDSSLLRSPTS